MQTHSWLKDTTVADATAPLIHPASSGFLAFTGVNDSNYVRLHLGSLLWSAVNARVVYLSSSKREEMLEFVFLYRCVCQHDTHQMWPIAHWAASLKQSYSNSLIALVLAWELLFVAVHILLYQLTDGRGGIVVSCVQQMALMSKWSTARALQLPVVCSFMQQFPIKRCNIITGCKVFSWQNRVCFTHRI